jgi:hypothetical protein
MLLIILTGTTETDLEWTEATQIAVPEGQFDNGSGTRNNRKQKLW